MSKEATILDSSSLTAGSIIQSAIDGQLYMIEPCFGPSSISVLMLNKDNSFMEPRKSIKLSYADVSKSYVLIRKVKSSTERIA